MKIGHTHVYIRICAMVTTILFKYQIIFISKWPTWVFKRKKTIVPSSNHIKSTRLDDLPEILRDQGRRRNPEFSLHDK